MECYGVSVIIPVYNVENYIGNCLESVLNQTYSDIEIICVNDGSGDQSLSVLETYKRKDKRIKVFSYETNRGVSHARNIGLREASGRYLYFLDADDLMVENALQYLINYAEKYETECIYFESDLLMEEEGLGAPRLEFSLNSIDKKVMKGTTLFKILMENDIYTSSVCRQFWKSDYLINSLLKFEEGLWAEDALFSLKAMLGGNRMMVVNKKYHIYRRHGGTMSTNMTPYKTISLFHICCEILFLWKLGNFEIQVERAIRKRLEQLLLQTKRLYFRNKDMITEADFSDEIERHLFEILLKQGKGISENIIINETNLQKIRKFDKVIVYGAANYAVDVVEALEHSSIEVSYLAVTSVHENTSGINGIPVMEIKDLQEFSDKAIVVLGVVKKNRPDVIETLKIYQFNHYIEFD